MSHTNYAHERNAHETAKLCVKKSFYNEYVDVHRHSIYIQNENDKS